MTESAVSKFIEAYDDETVLRDELYDLLREEQMLEAVRIKLADEVMMKIVMEELDND